MTNIFKRWKEGILAITPLQTVKISMFSYLFIYLGIIIGLIATFTSHSWWLFLILIGSFLLSSIAFIGLLQKLSVLKAMKQQLEELTNV